MNHIVENWDSIPQRIKDLKKKGGTKAKKITKAANTLANQTVAAQPKDGVKNSDRGTAELDQAYMAALERGDMETVKKLVYEAAKRAGFARRQFHETKKENIIHVFDLGLNTNASADYGTLFGVFTKSHSRSVGLGDKQMQLFVKASKCQTYVT